MKRVIKENWLYFCICLVLAIWMNCESIYYKNLSGMELSFVPVFAALFVFFVNLKIKPNK
jgi:hypothetical protein